MAQCSQKILRHFSVSLIFIVLLALFIESVAPNAEIEIKFVNKKVYYTSKRDVESLIDQGYEIAGMTENDYDFTFVFVKKDDHKKDQIGALVQKIGEQQKSVDTLVEQIKTLNGKLDKIVDKIGILVKQLGKKDGK
ncbi:hypothetical protein niasHT_022190 [Heterodera trifolii]|uniref:Uncharacterized protein n=1 Tax=Heterodera trifolii TaxID=157864 RepID=A0ABD2JVW0_9BILA